MNKVKSVLFAVGIMLALAFTFGCSSSGDGGGDSTQLSSSSDSWLRKSSSSLANSGSKSSSSVFDSSSSVQSSSSSGSSSSVRSSSSSSVARSSSSNGSSSSSSVQSSSSKGSSSSGGFSSSSSVNGQGVPFNENSQIYNGYYDDDDVFYVGNAYKGNGIIRMVKMDDYKRDIEISINAGSVTNGIVNLNLPQTISNEYLSDFLEDEERLSCTDYPAGIKIAEVYFRLYDNGERIGNLIIEYEGEHIRENIIYMYSSKAGKIACNLQDKDGNIITNIELKVGLNKIYRHENFYADGFTREYSTNNILTKEVKWIVWDANVGGGPTTNGKIPESSESGF